MVAMTTKIDKNMWKLHIF